MKVLLTLAAVVCCWSILTQAAVLTEQEKLDILTVHNEHRCHVDPPAETMQAMVWDTALAAVAQRYADTCPDGHNGDRSTWYAEEGGEGYVGENLAWGFSTFVAGVDAWVLDEVGDYDYDSNSCAVGGVCGHYTQVVWSDSDTLGCATPTQNDCPNWSGNRYYVCNYATGGNYNGFHPYVEGTGTNAACEAVNSIPIVPADQASIAVGVASSEGVPVEYTGAASISTVVILSVAMVVATGGMIAVGLPIAAAILIKVPGTVETRRVAMGVLELICCVLVIVACALPGWTRVELTNSDEFDVSPFNVCKVDSTDPCEATLAQCSVEGMSCAGEGYVLMCMVCTILIVLLSFASGMLSLFYAPVFQEKLTLPADKLKLLLNVQAGLVWTNTWLGFFVVCGWAAYVFDVLAVDAETATFDNGGILGLVVFLTYLFLVAPLTGANMSASSGKY